MKNLGKIEHKEKRAIGITKEPLRCDDDAFMVREGLRKPLLILNPSINHKTVDEQLDLDKMKKSCGKVKLSGSVFTKVDVELNPLKLIVNMKNPKKNPELKTTHSFMCFKSEIQDILSQLKDSGYSVNNVYYNNKPYKF